MGEGGSWEGPTNIKFKSFLFFDKTAKFYENIGFKNQSIFIAYLY
jgi:hypothetical protein